MVGEQLTEVASQIGSVLIVATVAAFLMCLNLYRVKRHGDGDTSYLKAYIWQRIFQVTAKNPDEIPVRLFGIDALERGQPGWEQARAALNNYCPPGSWVLVRRRGVEQHGRLVASLLVLRSLRDLSTWMLERGHAYLDPQFGQGEKGLERAEERARKRRRGVWLLPNQERPWVYRARKRAAIESTDSTLQ